MGLNYLGRIPAVLLLLWGPSILPAAAGGPVIGGLIVSGQHIISFWY